MLFFAVHCLFSQIDVVLSSYDIKLPVEFHETTPVVVAVVPVGAMHVYQALPSGFGVINVPVIVAFTRLALDILYLPVGVELMTVVPLGSALLLTIVPIVRLVGVPGVKTVPVTDPVICEPD